MSFFHFQSLPLQRQTHTKQHPLHTTPRIDCDPLSRDLEETNRRWLSYTNKGFLRWYAPLWQIRKGCTIYNIAKDLSPRALGLGPCFTRIRNFRKGFGTAKNEEIQYIWQALWVMDTPNATVDSWWFQSTMVTVVNFTSAACYTREISNKVFGKTYGKTWDILDIWGASCLLGKKNINSIPGCQMKNPQGENQLKRVNTTTKGWEKSQPKLEKNLFRSVFLLPIFFAENLVLENSSNRL